MDYLDAPGVRGEVDGLQDVGHDEFALGQDLGQGFSSQHVPESRRRQPLGARWEVLHVGDGENRVLGEVKHFFLSWIPFFGNKEHNYNGTEWN